jgi:hypothetical protein
LVASVQPGRPRRRQKLTGIHNIDPADVAQLFDGVDQETKDRIMFGAFNELFSRRAAATCPRDRSWIAHLGNVRRIQHLATIRAAQRAEEEPGN